MDPKNVVLVVSILIVIYVLWRAWRFATRISNRLVAHKILESRGLEAREYFLPSAGDDKALGSALRTFENTNFVVFDRQGKVVGRSLPIAMVATGRRKPTLQVVVDNTKPESDRT